MIGGDSDLVLEGLALDPQITHNTFVILPERKTASYCVSLWETTRSLKAMFPKMDSTTDVINMRTDLVALMIMNGNDYFGKIRGANFERLFSSYKETVNKFYQEPHSCFLINPQTLEFNNRFCLEFFSSLVEKATGDGNLMGEIMEEMPKGYDEDDDEISLMFKNSVYTVDSNIKGTVHSGKKRRLERSDSNVTPTCVTNNPLCVVSLRTWLRSWVRSSPRSSPHYSQ